MGSGRPYIPAVRGGVSSVRRGVGETLHPCSTWWGKQCKTWGRGDPTSLQYVGGKQCETWGRGDPTLDRTLPSNLHSSLDNTLINACHPAYRPLMCCSLMIKSTRHLMRFFSFVVSYLFISV